MEHLLDELKRGIAILDRETNGQYDLSDEALEGLYSVYPFNKFEYVISHLIADGVLTLDEYLEMRSTYLERNKYLYIFEITAPRTFGETWAQRHLNELVPEFQRPSKQLHAEYLGEYDFWVDGIRVEVKASRAVKRKSGESLTIKALSTDSSSGFDMNFQQLKPRFCDVFVWVGVWRDKIRYWVLSSQEVESNPYYSPGQHRGNVGEGQLWIKEGNLADFEQYLVEPRDLLDVVRRKGAKD